MGFKPRSSQAAFSIPLAELEQRLSAMGLSSAARELILYAEVEPLLFLDNDTWNNQFTAVFIEIPCLGRDPLVAVGSHPTVLVVTAPIDSPSKSLILGYPELLGVVPQADQGCIVFMEHVHCRDVCVVPDSTVVFAGGLTVERLACFDGPKTHALIERRFSAPLVISESAYLGKETAVQVGALCGYIKGVSRRETRTVKEPSDLVSALGSEAAYEAVPRLLRAKTTF